MHTKLNRHIRLLFYFGSILIIILTDLGIGIPFYRMFSKDSERRVRILEESILEQKKIYLETVILEKISDIDTIREGMLEGYDIISDAVSTVVTGSAAAAPSSEAGERAVQLFLQNAGLGILRYSSSPPEPKSYAWIREIPFAADGSGYLFVDSGDFNIRFKERVKQMIRETKLSDEGYIWVNGILDYAGGEDYAIRLVHPLLPHTEGLMLSTSMEDEKGNKPYKTELDGINQWGELFFDYYFVKTEGGEAAHKLSFAKLYEPFDWIIATGIYLDDLDVLMQNERTLMDSRLKVEFRTILFFTVFSVLVASLLFSFLERRINRMIREFLEEVESKNIELNHEKHQLSEAYQKIEEVAYQDSLTNLWNRRGMTSRIETEVSRALRHKRGFCLVMADIDYFKNVNDSYGHDAGDYVLREISNILTVNSRGEDLVARWGGEEFLLLINTADLDEGFRITEKFRAYIESFPFLYKDHSISLTMTFGIALFTGDKEWTETLKQADINLYAGKQGGRNRVVRC